MAQVFSGIAGLPKDLKPDACLFQFQSNRAASTPDPETSEGSVYSLHKPLESGGWLAGCLPGWLAGMVGRLSHGQHS